MSLAVVEPELVDFERLGTWMDEQGLPRGRCERIELLAGGTQNILVRFTRGGRDYVLRRGPRHLRPKSNEVMRREARVLCAPAPTYPTRASLPRARTSPSWAAPSSI
jgi:hypothetical protein